MCGISGIFAFTDSGRELHSRVRQAVEAMHSRGPDSQGVFTDGPVCLGHNRLSIIDTTDAASQPFSSPDGRYTIAFNGEFFNFREHREKLEQKGVKFRSGSDTEVLLYLFMEEGENCLQKINGFFAFAVYDALEKKLFIARDRYGEKPLYYYQTKDALYFASEMKGMLAMGIPRELDMVSLFAYLQLNYVPNECSMLKGVIKLRPGSFMHLSNKGIITGEFYDIPFQESHAVHDDYDTAMERIRTLLDQAVQRRLVSDVPLGAFLSGGIDSSIIAGLASRHIQKLNTYSIGFRDEPFFDETAFARIVARHFKTEHTEFSLTTDDLFQAVFDVLDYTDEPFADSSALAVYILSRETRRHVTVALSGDGADEMYGGYMKHSAEYRARFPGSAEKLARLGAPLWKLLPKSRNSFLTNKVRQLHRYASAAALDKGERYWRWCALASEDEASALMAVAPDMEEYFSVKSSSLEPLFRDTDMNAVFRADMKLVLPGDMLVKVDRMSMANSLEVRTPFLDVDHVNYLFSLPSDFKLQGNNRKRILRDAFASILPGEILERGKHGFEVPLLGWCRKGLNDLIENDLLNDEFVVEQGIFNPAETKNLKKRIHAQDPGDSASRIWALIVFQYWWKKYFK